MGFFSNGDRLFLLLNPDRLQFFTKKNNPFELIFPQEAVNHQEVIDRKIFEKTIKDFLIHIKKHEVIIFLGNELIFQKSIPLSQKETLADEETTFFNEIPFPQGNVVKKTIRTNSHIWFFSSNRDLYQIITLL